MGVNFTQRCVLGVSFEGESLKNIISEEEYRDEPRYDTRTGKQIKTERIIIKDEVYNYIVLGETFDELGCVEFDDLDVVYDYNEEDETLYIGEEIGDGEDFGRVDLLCGSISLHDLSEKAKTLSERLKVDVKEINLHFIASVG